MNWKEARKLLSFRLPVPASLAGEGRRQAAPSGPRIATARAASLCVASGKGGTGKSVFTASLAAKLAAVGRTLILDADMGIGNAHILQGVSPERSFVELVAGTAAPHEIVARCADNLDLIAAGSGVSSMSELSPFEMHRIAEAIEQLETNYKYLLVDSAAGVSKQTVTFAATTDLVVVVTTPAVTAMTDAYAFLKVLLRCRPDVAPLLVVNRAHDLAEAQSVVKRMESVCQRFLSRKPRWIGWIPFDDRVLEAINARTAIVNHDPDSPAAKAIEHLSQVVLEEFEKTRVRGLGHSLMGRVVHTPRLV